ncbi:MAG: hypothetical protein V1834_02490 [Candidatus Micrarchaeota archaeon]
MKNSFAIVVLAVLAVVFLAGAGTGIGKVTPLATCDGAPTLGIETGGGGAPTLGLETGGGGSHVMSGRSGNTMATSTSG